MNKRAIRREFSSKRAAIPRAEAVSKSTSIAQNVQNLVNWHNVRRAHMYRAHRKLNEVETAWFEAFLATIWPQIELTIGDISKTARLPVGSYDLALVPLLAFDGHRNRLGFGGGWYDKFLRTQTLATTIGLAYDAQEFNGVLPTESHDIRLDFIVTETRVIKA